MYSAIASNKRKTWLLLLASVALVGLVGYAIDYYADIGGGLTVAALVYAIVSALVAYYSVDKLALWASGAKLIEKKDAPELYRLVENLCITGGQPLPKIYIINDPVPNAFATGRDPEHSSVAFTTGLLERLDRTELEGVVAHELSHIQNYDIRVMTIVVVLVSTVTLMVDLFFRVRWHGSGDRKGGGVLVLALMFVAMILAVLAANLIKLAVSRRREYLADASGALLPRYPEGLARALEKISASAAPMAHAHSSTAHLFISNPFGRKPGMVASLFSTHPPVEERVKALRSMIQ